MLAQEMETEYVLMGGNEILLAKEEAQGYLEPGVFDC